MKKLLGLLMAVAMVFAFAMPAAADHVSPCFNCNEYKSACDLSNIICGDKVSQGSDSCTWFDYDSLSSDGYGAYGYCNGDTNPNCRVIFDICECSDTTQFVEDATIGIRMTSLTSGVYFTGDTVYFKKYPKPVNTPCADSDLPFTGDELFPGTYVYKDVSGKVVDPAQKITNECDVPSSEAANSLTSPAQEGYVITHDDVINGVCLWWLNMPAMRYDLDEITSGAMVQVKIELLIYEGGICDEWQPICECIVELGNLCCEDVGPCPTAYSMYFPYVTFVDPWANGIVISNIGSVNPLCPVTTIANMEALFTLTDVNGDEYIYIKKDFTTANWSFVLADELPNFSGMPAAGPAWLRVETNFLVDGYSYIENGVFGLGTLPRQWTTVLDLIDLPI